MKPQTAYSIESESATTGVGQNAANGCSGTIAALPCTETNVPNGNWQYTVIPIVSNWRGSESPKSAAIAI